MVYLKVPRNKAKVRFPSSFLQVPIIKKNTFFSRQFLVLSNVLLLPLSFEQLFHFTCLNQWAKTVLGPNQRNSTAKSFQQSDHKYIWLKHKLQLWILMNRHDYNTTSVRAAKCRYQVPGILFPAQGTGNPVQSTGYKKSCTTTTYMMPGIRFNTSALNRVSTSTISLGTFPTESILSYHCLSVYNLNPFPIL